MNIPINSGNSFVRNIFLLKVKCAFCFFLSYCVLFYQLWVISYRGIGLFLIVERPFQETN